MGSLPDGGRDAVSAAFDPEVVLSGLRPFQRATVEYAFDRYFGEDPVNRFLVADEVGLGKTMVARGLIAKLIEHHLKERDRRIDVIYVCSNHAIAQQNFSKLAIVGRNQRPVTDRITMLPLRVRGLDAHTEGFDRAINIIPITPQTSLDLRSGSGMAEERALLWQMLRHEKLLGRNGMGRRGSKRRAATVRLLGAPVQTAQRFEARIADIDPDQIDPQLWNNFVKTLLQSGSRDGPPVLQEFQELQGGLTVPGREYAPPWSDRRKRLVARLRLLLAESCVEALEPDLVILDEFQRFPKLLNPEDPAGSLATQLFRYPGCKALLLSATPYRMYTRAHELSEDHHSDFLTTTEFLIDGQRNPERVENIRAAMVSYKDALLSLSADGIAPVKQAKAAVEAELKRVMCRTERLGVSGDRNGMLNLHPKPPITAQLASGDLESLKELDEVARSLGTRDVLEFWKSTPYALNMMDGYQLSDRFEKRGTRSHAGRLRHLLDLDAVRSYNRVDPANARMRGLLDDLGSREAWKQLWLHPSLPYYKPGKPFDSADMRTKRLVFSSWAVVPKAIASLVSYEAERNIHAHRKRVRPLVNSVKGRKSIGAPLRWSQGARGQGGTMIESLFVLPGRRLGELTDPLSIARVAGGKLGSMSSREILTVAGRNVRGAIAKLKLPTSQQGRPDSVWYAVALLRLEEKDDPGSVEEWLTPDSLGDHEGMRIWASHVKRLKRFLVVDPDGPVPPDLSRVLALVGVGAPGIAAQRALARVLPKSVPADRAGAAMLIGNALRLMFDLPDSVDVVRPTTSREPHWQSVLKYSVNGNLQSVLDEYVHVLDDWVGSDEQGGKLGAIRDAAVEAIGINAASLSVKNVNPSGRVAEKQVPMRTRFALRLSDGATEDEGAVTRTDSVRKAFNSPFWPFVLATTSIGQEGLDFHLYCHAVVHWNLPHNPVDLEQREGRVHRYKNHAVRRNLAADRPDLAAGGDGDPWRRLFDGVGRRDDGGIFPDWVYVPKDGSAVAMIERHVPAEPLSIDRQRLEELIRLLGLYRLAFGQPRQEEMLAALKSSLGGDASVEGLTIDLSPG